MLHKSGKTLNNSSTLRTRIGFQSTTNLFLGLVVHLVRPIDLMIRCITNRVLLRP